MEELLQENARLRAENEKLRNLAFTHTSEDKDGNGTATEVFRLLELPKEIRLLIYEYAVVPGTITLRFDATAEDSATNGERYNGIDAPIYGDTQLFCVSKQIKEEALPLYLAKNLFIWPVVNTSYLQLYTFPDGVIYGSNASKYLRHLSISFDYRGIDAHLCAATWLELAKRPWVQQLQPGLRPLHAHVLADAFMYGVWIAVGRGLAQFSRLHRLSVSFEKTYCTWGCCRRFEKAVNLLFLEDWESAPKVIEIRGLENEEEREYFEDRAEVEVAAGTVLRFA